MGVTKKYFSHPQLLEVEEKDVVLGLRSPKKRSLLSVNEHFEGEHNDKIHFLFSIHIGSGAYAPQHKISPEASLPRTRG